MRNYCTLQYVCNQKCCKTLSKCGERNFCKEYFAKKALLHCSILSHYCIVIWFNMDSEILISRISLLHAIRVSGQADEECSKHFAEDSTVGQMCHLQRDKLAAPLHIISRVGVSLPMFCNLVQLFDRKNQILHINGV